MADAPCKVIYHDERMKSENQCLKYLKLCLPPSPNPRRWRCSASRFSSGRRGGGEGDGYRCGNLNEEVLSP